MQNTLSTIENNKSEAHVLKQLNLIVQESKDKERNYEIQKTQLRISKNKYNQQLKQFNVIVKQILHNETSLDAIESIVSKLKTKQQMILSSITSECVGYLNEIYPKVRQGIMQGFMFFLGLNMDQLDIIKEIFRTDSNLKKFLENGEANQRNLHRNANILSSAVIKVSFETMKNLINEIRLNYPNEFIYPLDVIYNYMDNVYSIIETEEEGMKIKEMIDSDIIEKNKLFIFLRTEENEILKQNHVVELFEKYIIAMKKVIQRYKYSQSKMNPLDVDGFNECLVELAKLERHTKGLKSGNNNNDSNHKMIIPSSGRRTLMGKSQSMLPKNKGVSMSALQFTPLISKPIDESGTLNMTKCSTQKVFKNDIGIQHKNMRNTMKDKVNAKSHLMKEIQLNKENDTIINNSCTEDSDKEKPTTKLKAKPPTMQKETKNDMSNLTISNLYKKRAQQINKLSKNRNIVNNSSMKDSSYKHSNKSIGSCEDYSMNDKYGNKLKESKELTMLSKNHRMDCSSSLYEINSNHHSSSLFSDDHFINNNLFDDNICDEVIISQSNLHQLNGPKILAHNPLNRDSVLKGKHNRSDMRRFCIDKPVNNGGCCVSCT